MTSDLILNLCLYIKWISDPSKRFRHVAQFGRPHFFFNFASIILENTFAFVRNFFNDLRFLWLLITVCVKFSFIWRLYVALVNLERRLL